MVRVASERDQNQRSRNTASGGHWLLPKVETEGRESWTDGLNKIGENKFCPS